MKNETAGQTQTSHRGPETAFPFRLLLAGCRLVPAFFLFLSPLKAFTLLKYLDTPFEIAVKHDTDLYSRQLHRRIVLDIVLPPDYDRSNTAYKVLYMNDGQDLERLRLIEVLEGVYQKGEMEPVVVVAIHCGERIQEYGTAAQADYKQRGAKAGDYTAFVLEELMPYIQKNYRIKTGAEHTVFCGFSLGGLSAFDMVWHHPERFSKAGIFSGSFWWRQKAYDEQYNDDRDRIMHRLVRESGVNKSASPQNGKPKTVNPQFWLQTGTEDEKDDRNNNGVIDSIEDTLDLIAELEKKGYVWGRDIRYVEVKGGHHDQATWSAVMPDFLRWAFGR